MERAFVFDFDATIAPEQGRFTSKSVRRLLMKLQELGFANVMLTGRPLAYAIGPKGMDLFDARCYLEAAIGGYGASVWYAKANVTNGLTPELSPEIREEFRRVGIPSRAVFSDANSILVKGRYGPVAHDAIARLNASRAAQGQPPIPVVEKRSPYSHVFQSSPATKAQAFDRVVVGQLGIAGDCVIGAGDSWESDGPFLAKCRFGVIPANGDPRLKAMPNAVVSRFPGARGTVDGMERVLKLLALEGRSVAV